MSIPKQEAFILDESDQKPYIAYNCTIKCGKGR
jgi:hypothetical protein